MNVVSPSMASGWSENRPFFALKRGESCNSLETDAGTHNFAINHKLPPPVAFGRPQLVPILEYELLSDAPITSVRFPKPVPKKNKLSFSSSASSTTTSPFSWLTSAYSRVKATFLDILPKVPKREVRKVSPIVHKRQKEARRVLRYFLFHTGQLHPNYHRDRIVTNCCNDLSECRSRGAWKVWCLGNCK